jgi:hypothetical protein
VLLILVGAPGSGKSTFAEAVMGGAAAVGRPWARVCQVSPTRSALSSWANLLSTSLPFSVVSLMFEGKHLQMPNGDSSDAALKLLTVYYNAVLDYKFETAVLIQLL